MVERMVWNAGGHDHGNGNTLKAESSLAMNESLNSCTFCYQSHIAAESYDVLHLLQYK
jgi:hypothetical protein